MEIEAGVRERLVEAQEAFKRYRAPVSWVKRENIHLTVKFLGDVEEARVPDVTRALETVSAGGRSGRYNVWGIGSFPERGNPRVIWAGLAGDLDALEAAAGGVDRAMATLGFEPERRRFRPHLTIGRVRGLIRDRRFFGALADRAQESFGETDVRELVLFRSELNPAGSIYTPLARCGLAAPD
ncbi:MAG: RNA 2',3'-cyclic phosphodiesterase [Nitrospirae bacterium]|nr:RNA 2',3'-cyclic phosphodiesterase [Nitrospirota bacterium]